MPHPLSQPFRNAYIKDKLDALIFTRAALEGRVDRASQRLSMTQRRDLSTTGSIFVFEEKEADMERWTDGRRWSRSRQLSEKFFVYFEERSGQGSPGNDSAISRRTRRGDPGDQVAALVGPLRHIAGFSHNSLIKKTITISLDGGKEFHIISYFTVAEVLNGAIPSVRDHPFFQGVDPVQDGSFINATYSTGLEVPSPRPSRPRAGTWSNGPPQGIPETDPVHTRHSSWPLVRSQSDGAVLGVHDSSAYASYPGQYVPAARGHYIATGDMSPALSTPSMTSSDSNSTHSSYAYTPSPLQYGGVFEPATSYDDEVPMPHIIYTESPQIDGYGFTTCAPAAYPNQIQLPQLGFAPIGLGITTSQSPCSPQTPTIIPPRRVDSLSATAWPVTYAVVQSDQWTYAPVTYDAQGYENDEVGQWIQPYTETS